MPPPAPGSNAAASRARPACPATSVCAFTITGRKPPGGIAWYQRRRRMAILRAVRTEQYHAEPSMWARSGGWGGSIAEKKISAYLLDRTNGATMLTIPAGHTLAALRDVLGEVAEVAAVLATRRSTALAADTRETLPVSAPNQVLVSGVLASGAPVSIHYRGGTARDDNGLFWEINGTQGDIRGSGPSGHTQMVPLSLKGARGQEKAFRPLEVPASYRSGWPEDVVPGNVARLYARMARDLREGTRTAPTFDDAVAVHRVIAAIETAAQSRRRIAPA